MNEQRIECVDGQWKPVEPKGMPDGVLGQVMPGAMAEANEHNNQELWKQQKDPSYVPQFKHPEILPVEGQENEPEEEPVQDTGCVVLPAFPPWGCQQEAKAASGEPAIPEEEPEECPVPDTMPGIWKLLGFKADSLYDLGIHTLSPAGKKPSLVASMKAYRKNMLLTVGRALLLREYGKEFSSEQVRKSAVASWKNNGRMKKYSEVLHANLGEEVEKRVLEILGEIPGFIEGKISSKAKYMDTFKGEKWSIKSFVLMCKVTGQVDLKKTGWRATKKS